jgi:hypothetical protein
VKKPANIKKLVAVAYDHSLEQEQIQGIISGLTPHAASIFPIEQLVLDALSKSIGRSLDHPFKTPLVVNDSHVRHFFSKLSLGIRPVQNFVGKVLGTPAEAIYFFIYYVGVQSFGEYWLLDQLVSYFEDQKDGIHIVTNVGANEILELKRLLGKQFVTIFVGEDPDKVKSDYFLKPNSSAGAIKKVAKAIMEKTNQIEMRRQVNE